MSEDDQRMHGGNTPGMAPSRSHERHEAPVQLKPEPGAADTPPLDGPTQDMLREDAHRNDAEAGLPSDQEAPTR